MSYEYHHNRAPAQRTATYGPVVRQQDPELGLGMTEVRAASSVVPGYPGVWWARAITPQGEVSGSGRPVVRNRSRNLDGTRVRRVPLYYTRPISPIGYLNNSGLGADAEEAEGGLESATTQKTQTLVDTPVPSVSPPDEILSKKELALLSDEELTADLNAAIAEGWRIKTCDGPYCSVRAARNRARRVALLAEYRRRQMARSMPPLEEPIHTLAYGRYKLSKTVLDWAESTLTGRLLWPVKIYTKAGATALEDIVGSRYLSAFIVSSPLVGIYALRRLGFCSWGWTLFGGYLGMTVGALLPMGLFALSRLLGAAKEEDFLWAVS